MGNTASPPDHCAAPAHDNDFLDEIALICMKVRSAGDRGDRISG
jgi:hypothetical protein